MTAQYDLLIAGDLDFSRLPMSLAGMVGVSPALVDVAKRDVVERNWIAPVLCTFHHKHGDVAWVLEITVGDAAPRRPGEAEAAARLAEDLRVPVLYPAEEAVPSAYWLASPDGPPTRARVYDGPDGDGDGSELVIDAVERPVAALPQVRVELQPEVIKAHEMVTPVADDFAAWIGARLDRPPVVGDRYWLAQDTLGAWESLTVRMATGWPPDGWYPARYYYGEDLPARDDLADAASGLPAEVAGRFADALERVDEAFRRATREVERDPSRGWWWGREPDPVPWPQGL